MRDFRVRALKRAVRSSLFVPLMAGALMSAQMAGVRIPEFPTLGALLLILSGIPSALHLFSAMAGLPWYAMERDWLALPTWQRWMSSVVALVCGITTGAAVVLFVLSLAEVDAKAREEPDARTTTLARPAGRR